MALATTAPAPGSMTVPFLFQWEAVLTVVVLAVVLAVAVLVRWATRPGAEERADWEAWLSARSRRSGTDSPQDLPGGPVRS